MSKETFYLPVTYEMSGFVEVEAESIEEAIKIFDKMEDEGHGFELPNDSEYTDGSFALSSYDVEYLELVNRLEKKLRQNNKRKENRDV